MTVTEIKNEIMFQTNNDVEDLGDFLPYLMDYINEGYDRLVNAWADTHIHTEEYPALTEGTDVPNLPEWTHRALADWATWLIYRNGNPNKQTRGYQFKNAFEEVLAKIVSEGGIKGKTRNFYNIPK